MKKVLFVATVVKSHIMVFHIPFLKWFKENGYETYVCARNDYEDKKECVIPYCDNFYDLPFERSPIKLNNFKTYRRLKQIIDSNHFDIIHCHTPMGGALTRLAARSQRRKHTTVIYTAHGFHFYKGAPIVNWLLYYPVERVLARFTDVLITINNEDYNRAQKFKAKIIKYIPGVGIDVKRYKEVQPNKLEKLKEIGVPEDSFVALSVGELNSNKNQEVIIRAIAKLCNPNIYYILCGEGENEEYLKGLAKELGIEQQVLLLGFRNDIAEISKASDIFVFPSFREGLSLSLMEAMSSGLPVVCSKIRGNIDLIQDGKGGYLVDSSNIDGFRECIEKLIIDEDTRKMFGNFNQNYIGKFSIDNVKKQLVKVYNQ